MPVALLLIALPVSAQDDAGLEQLFIWRGLHLYTPFGYFLNDGGSEVDAIAMTRGGLLGYSTSFEFDELAVTVRDYSDERTTLSPEDVTTLEAFFFDPDDARFGEVEIKATDDFTLAGVDFEDDFARGRAVLVLSDNYAFQIVGVSAPDLWEREYAAQFDTIIDRVRLGPAAYETETE